MFKALLRTRISALGAYFTKSSRTKNKSKTMKILFALLMVYAYGCITLMFGMLYYQLYAPLSSVGLTWFFFGMAGIMTFALCFIGTVFTAQVQLYQAKDNDLLLSMPIPPSYILITRMLLLLFLSYVFELVAFVPAIFIYYNYEAFSLLGLLCFIAVFLFLPLLSIVMASIVGWLVELISSRMRNKSAATTIASLLFLALYFYGYSKVNSYIQMLIANGEEIAATIKRVVPPAYYMGMALEKQDIVSLLIFMAICLIPMAIVYMVLSKSFIKIATSKRGASKVRYREKAMKVSSVRSALIKKDMKHFLSSPTYMMNGALGIVFEIALAVALVVKQDLLAQYTSMFPELEGAPGAIVILALCIISSMNMISASSISLEGKNLWISQSIPVDGSQVLISKALMHMTITVPPTLLSGIICAAALKASPVMALLLIAVPVLVNVFCALLGVVVNLKFPKFDWTNETVVVKQSASPMICMFGGAAAVIAPMLIYMFLVSKVMSVDAFLGILGGIFAVISLLLYLYLVKHGDKAYMELDN